MAVTRPQLNCNSYLSMRRREVGCEQVVDDALVIPGVVKDVRLSRQRSNGNVPQFGHRRERVAVSRIGTSHVGHRSRFATSAVRRKGLASISSTASASRFVTTPYFSPMDTSPSGNPDTRERRGRLTKSTLTPNRAHRQELARRSRRTSTQGQARKERSTVARPSGTARQSRPRH